MPMTAPPLLLKSGDKEKLEAVLRASTASVSLVMQVRVGTDEAARAASGALLPPPTRTGTSARASPRNDPLIGASGSRPWSPPERRPTLRRSVGRHLVKTPSPRALLPHPGRRASRGGRRLRPNDTHAAIVIVEVRHYVRGRNSPSRAICGPLLGTSRAYRRSRVSAMAANRSSYAQ